MRGPHQVVYLVGVFLLAGPASGFVCSPKLSLGASSPGLRPSSSRPSICRLAAIGLVPPPPPPKRSAGQPPPPPSKPDAGPAPGRQAGDWRDAVLGHRKGHDAYPRPAETNPAIRFAKAKFSEDMQNAERERDEAKKKKKAGPPPPPMLSMKEWEVRHPRTAYRGPSVAPPIATSRADGGSRPLRLLISDNIATGGNWADSTLTTCCLQVCLRIPGAANARELSWQFECAKDADYSSLEVKWLKDGASRAEIKKRLGIAMTIRAEARNFALGEKPWEEGKKFPGPPRAEFYK